VVPGPSAIAANLALAKGVAASATTMLARSIFDDKLAVVVHVVVIVQGIAKVVAARHLARRLGRLGRLAASIETEPIACTFRASRC